MIPGVGMQELVVIGIVAIILFGSKLPEVAKKAGKSYYDFKKGLFDIQKGFDPRNFMDDDSSSSSSSSSSYDDDYDDYDEASAPRFEPPPSSDD